MLIQVLLPLFLKLPSCKLGWQPHATTCANPGPRYPKEPHPQGRSYPQVVHRLSTSPSYPQGYER